MSFVVSVGLWRILERCNVPLNIFVYGKVKGKVFRCLLAEKIGEEGLKKIYRLPKEALIEIITISEEVVGIILAW